MRAILTWCLGRVAGPDLASDILGDAAESGWSGGRIAMAGAGAAFDRARAALRVSGLFGWIPRFRGARTDLKQSVRALRRSPWYAGTMIIVLGLTGALATAAFAIVDGVLFKPLPYPEPDHLFTASGPGGYVLSQADLASWKHAAPETQMALYQGAYVVGSTGGTSPRPVRAAGVDPRFFDVLGQRPIAGNWLARDFEPGSARRRAMITFGFWRRAFGGRPDVIGQPFDIAGAADWMRRPLGQFEVAGVLPDDFVFPDNQATVDLLLPIAVPADRVASRNDAVGRALIRTSSPVGSLADRLLAAYGPIQSNPGDSHAKTVTVSPVPAYLLLWQKDSLASAFSAAGILMLIAIFNVAGLSVLRGQTQLQDLGVRRALGASRADLLRLAVIDTAPLVAAGMAVALVATPWAMAAAVSRMPSNIVFLKPPHMDWRVVAFWMVLSAVTVGVCAFLRVVFTSSAAVTDATRRDAAGTPRHRRFGRAVIVVQVALAFAMTVGGTLLVKTLWKLWEEPIGFSLDHASLIEVSHQDVPMEARRARVLDLVDRVLAVPGVEHVTAVTGASFLSRSRRVIQFDLPPGINPMPEPGAWFVPADFFDFLSISPLAGRVPTAAEVAAGAAVTVLSESVARRYFPGSAAVGHTLTTRSKQYAVIGVVRDVQLLGLADDNAGQVYVPGALTDQRAVLLVRGRVPLERVLTTVNHAKTVGVMRALPFNEAMGSARQLTIFRVWLFSAFSVAALTIVGAGIFGVIAMSVGRRTRELGIRSALGATRESLVGLFVREQLLSVGAGLAAGGALAWWAGGFVKTYLFKLTPTDVSSWIMAALALVIVAGASALIPALRASRIDPVRALRVD